jgi:hypothetical protein
MNRNLILLLKENELFDISNPPSAVETSRNNLRNYNDINGTSTETNPYYYACLPSCLRNWNDLTAELHLLYLPSNVF